MYTIALWARRNIILSRIIVVSAKITSWLLAALLGLLLFNAKLFLPIYKCYAMGGLLLVVALYLYPPVSNSIAAKWVNFKRRKFCDFVLPLATCIVIAASANNACMLNAYPNAEAANFSGKLTAEEIIQSGKSAESLTRQEKKTLRAEFFHQAGVFTKAVAEGDKEAQSNAWKIILAIVALVGLLILLAACACTIACNGAEGLAIIILLVGVTGLVLGFMAVMKSIKKGSKKTGDTVTKTPETIPVP